MFIGGECGVGNLAGVGGCCDSFGIGVAGAAAGFAFWGPWAGFAFGPFAWAGLGWWGGAGFGLGFAGAWWGGAAFWGGIGNVFLGGIPPACAAAMTFPTIPLTFPGGPGGGGLVTGPTLFAVVAAGSPILPFQAVVRLPTGQVAPATGNDINSGNALIGVSAGLFMPGQTATIAKTGATINIPMSVAGDLFRDVNGMPVPYASLPVIPQPNQTYTNKLGVGSALGFDVDLDQTEVIA